MSTHEDPLKKYLLDVVSVQSLLLEDCNQLEQTNMNTALI